MYVLKMSDNIVQKYYIFLKAWPFSRKNTRFFRKVHTKCVPLRKKAYLCTILLSKTDRLS